MDYNLIAELNESTVVSEYIPVIRKETTYQSEAQLEKEFIELLKVQAYEYLTITTEKELIKNLRKQLEVLNSYEFSEQEWTQIFTKQIANQTLSIEDKAFNIQENHKLELIRDDGTPKNIDLLDKVNIHNNKLQVINQYATEGGAYSNRYDVTILVNGLPLVHVELKRRGVDIKEAFNQIDRYARDSFWADSGLFEYVQLFVISNGTYTKYYSNTTRLAHVKEKNEGNQKKSKKVMSNSFEFTSWWADANNKPITDLMDFGRTFFAKHTLLNILIRYCVFTSDKTLLAMRPYQIVATERIIGRVISSSNYKKEGTIGAGGYIWHTTGSGKTLTSFKAAQLASKLPNVDKVLFVVDRKDLDYQTMVEYDKFEKGAANSNTNTNILRKQMEDPNARIIITTIQKLATLIKKNKTLEVYKKHIVIIFDECHRSQFGEMHTAIKKTFKKYHLFGFTGTPIFAINSTSNTNPHLRTTEQAFGDKLHTYTIVDAITDKNVLPFRIDYISTMREEENISDTKVWDIDRERALGAPERVSNVVKYILNNFDRKTKRNTKPYLQTVLANVHEVASARDRKKIEEIKNKIRLTGFNSIFAVASIDMAKQYYNEFKRQQAELPELSRLKVATIFSFGVNDEEDMSNGFMADENPEDTSQMPVGHREFLEEAIGDYNQMFSTNYDTSSNKFQNYYKDVSLRMKQREVDLLIVVNMFLTGFDAKTLNTLWVDKNLRMHGLLQAYSRTNRILNTIKTFGNVVCFRNLEKATNESIALFGDKDAGGVVLLRTFDEYYQGYNDGKKDIRGYEDMVDELLAKFPATEMIVGEEAKKEFIRLYSAILKLRNVLSVFDEFEGKEMLSERDVQDYQSKYISIYDEFRPKKVESENVNDDIVFEMELIKQIDINIDYILQLIKKYHESHQKDTEVRVTIQKAIDSSPDMRNKKELIERFIDSLTPQSDVDEDWYTYVDQQKRNELDSIIEEERLNHEATYDFVDNAFREGYVDENGTAITGVLPAMSRFTPSGARAKKRQTVIDKLSAFFRKFWDISGGRW